MNVGNVSLEPSISLESILDGESYNTSLCMMYDELTEERNMLSLLNMLMLSLFQV